MYLSRQLRETLSAVTSKWSQTYCNMVPVHYNMVAVQKNSYIFSVIRSATMVAVLRKRVRPWSQSLKKDCDYGHSPQKTLLYVSNELKSVTIDDRGWLIDQQKNSVAGRSRSTEERVAE